MPFDAWGCAFRGANMQTRPEVCAVLIRWFDDVGIEDVASVGGKNASLGELRRGLSAAGVPVPDGFAVTAEAYWRFLDANGLRPVIGQILERLARGDLPVERAGEAIRAQILGGEVPADLSGEIEVAYVRLGERTGRPGAAVAVRSSATAEDLPSASFAGQQESFLGVSGATAVLDAVRRCFASLFTARAIAYREEHGFEHMDVALAVGVQELVCWPPSSSGVMFTVDTESGFPGVMLVEAAWGAGEAVVQGLVDPDAYLVFKPLLGVAPAPLVGRTRGAKLRQMRVGSGGTASLLPTSEGQQAAFVLSDAEVLELATWAAAIEAHYGRAMDIEWARDAATGEFAVVQARPLTTVPDPGAPWRTFVLLEHPEPVLTGMSIGQGVAAGRVHRAPAADDLATFRPGDVLVTVTTSPDFVPVMRQAAAIVTETGGRTSHAAIVSRELGVPAVVGAAGSMAALRDGEPVTVSCAEGSTGHVYRGEIPFRVEEEGAGELPATRTRIMLNLAIPEAALRWWRLPADGVGLARIEFIIANRVRAHPMALLEPDRVADARERDEVLRLIRGYGTPADFFVRELAGGIATIAAAQYPRPVIVRTSDFKTNEYARLLGGAAFEPHEENPMLGWRGASRYYDPRYREAFRLECRAIRHAREVSGLSNVAVMIPFCRTPDEADRVLAVMADEGLERGRDGLQLYLMCEIPSNVVLASEFARRFDGFSIGSNDLTQLVLGVDRDAADLKALFDERSPAVTSLIRQVIREAHACGATVGICGQAPSDYPEFAAFLVECGIDSMSVNPDSFARTRRVVAEAERRLAG